MKNKFNISLSNPLFCRLFFSTLFSLFFTTTFCQSVVFSREDFLVGDEVKPLIIGSLIGIESSILLGSISPSAMNPDGTISLGKIKSVEIFMVKFFFSGNKSISFLIIPGNSTTKGTIVQVADIVNAGSGEQDFINAYILNKNKLPWDEINKQFRNDLLTSNLPSITGTVIFCAIAVPLGGPAGVTGCVIAGADQLVGASMLYVKTVANSMKTKGFINSTQFSNINNFCAAVTAASSIASGLSGSQVMNPAKALKVRAIINAVLISGAGYFRM